MEETKSNLPLLLFLLISIGTSVTCSLIDPSFYSKILGDQKSIIIFITSGIAAYLSFTFINRYNLHFISSAFSKRKLLFYFSISILLGFMPALIDTWHSFPRDINVLFPESVLIYPTIGVLAEILFHLLPATLLLVIFGSKIRNRAWIIIISVAAVESVFQVIFSIGPKCSQLFIHQVYIIQYKKLFTSPLCPIKRPSKIIYHQRNNSEKANIINPKIPAKISTRIIFLPLSLLSIPATHW